jgi:hypothetical protein
MKKLLVALLGVALVLLGAALPLVLPRHCPVSRAACERIKEGMTKAEVHAILGGLPGDYTTRPGIGPVLVWSGAWEPGQIDLWHGDEGAVVVHYSLPSSGEEKVTAANFWEAEPCTPGLIEFARWRLGRRKERWRP